MAELEQAAGAIEQMVSPFQVQRCSFYVVLPNGTPRQFVSWFFSSMGTAEWPPVDEASEFGDDERASMKQAGMLLRPKDVSYRHTNPDPAVRKQIVLKWDDGDGTVILEGYLDPQQPPAMTRRLKLPRNVIPDAVAQAVVQSNLEMGMSFQAFE